MAVPTFGSIQPALIFTGGQLVRIAGAGFQIPYPIPDSNGVLPAPLPTVQVLFNGKAGSDVRVYSSGVLTVVAPANDPGNSSITIKNLNSLGAPIPGELITTPNAIAYARVDLSVEADFTRLNRALVKLFRQQVIANVALTTSVDYSDQAGEALETVATADLPCVHVSLPVQKTHFGEYAEDSGRPEETQGTNYLRRSTFRTVDVTWQVRLFDKSSQRALNLATLFQQVLKDNTTLAMDRDGADSSKGQIEYEIYQDSDFAFADSPNNSDVVVASTSVTLRGFWFEDFAGFTESLVVEKGEQTESIAIGVGTFEP